MNFIKNIEDSKVLSLIEQVQYEEGKVISLTLAQQPGVAMTLFAIGEGEEIGGHSAPGDAFVYCLDGSIELTLCGVTRTVSKGECIVMPAGSPHALKAKERFKMLLTVVK